MRLLKHNELRDVVSTGDITKVKVLLDALGPEKEIIVNMAPSGANTLLFIASQIGYHKVVKALIEADADGRSHAVTKYSPLYTAVHHGHIKVVKILLEKFPEMVQHRTVERWLPFHAACINGFISIVEILISHEYPEEMMTTFRDPTGKWEWRLPFDPNIQDVTKQTALFVSCLLGNKPLLEVLLNWKVKCTKISLTSQDSEDSQVTQEISSPMSPTRRRISYGIQSIMSRLSLGQGPEKNVDESMRSPLDLNLLCGQSRETALLASVRGGFLDVAALLLQNGADPNIIARPVEDQSDPKFTDEIYGLSNAPLAEAVRQKSLPMVELLLKFGAKDEQSTALTTAIDSADEQILCRLLAIRSHQDPEYKINKKGLNDEYSEVTSPSISNLTYSALYPNTPTMVNWHSNTCRLTYIKMSWLSEAVLYCNPKLKPSPKSHVLALGALTRIDISHNSLVSLPPEIFNLCSLRTLNVAQNKLEILPAPIDTLGGKSPGSRRSSKTSPKEYNCPVLEELYLQDNHLSVIPSHIFRLPYLVILDISNNKLEELPFEMWRAPKLKELNIAFNLLKDLPVLKDTSGDQCGTEPPSPVSEASPYIPNTFDENNTVSRGRTVASLDLVHHHIWSKTLEITEQELRLPDARLDNSVSQLSSLNLANNLFMSIPVALPCLAVNLTRLNMAYNSLRSMGHVTSYPASLKQLDLGHNEISCWPSLPRIAASDPHLACYNPQESEFY